MRKYFLRFFPLYCFTAAVMVLLCYSGSRTVSVMVQNTPLQRQNIFIIDAGHGGEDGGATSCTGVLESQINLEIAGRLNDLLHFLGHETKMIRTSDISIYTQGNTIAAKKVSDLKQRVKIVNETQQGILVSIHQNIFADSRYSGAQVFYNDQSRKLAGELQGNLIAALNPGSNRKSKAANGIYLMQNIEKPGILVECGFLSNPEEEQRLRSEDYQKKLCCVLASTLNLHTGNT